MKRQTPTDFSRSTLTGSLAHKLAWVAPICLGLWLALWQVTA